MEPLENRIVQRYFRKLIAYPEGAVVHHVDCDFFSVFMCSCGLLADLRTDAPEKASELFPAFAAQIVVHDATRTILLAEEMKNDARTYYLAEDAPVIGTSRHPRFKTGGRKACGCKSLRGYQKFSEGSRSAGRRGAAGTGKSRSSHRA